VSRRLSSQGCARALWLLGLTAPTDAKEVNAAWRARVARTHPDLHASSPAKAAAAETLTRALNDAKDTVLAWIAAGNEWPTGRGGPAAVRFDEPDPWPEREPAPEEAPICPRTGLRAGDRVRRWPFDGLELATVTGTETDGPNGPTWVLLLGEPAERSERVRLAAYSCPVCGACAGPDVDEATVRPCPECLVDLRRLERRPEEADRNRRAIEARTELGLATAQRLLDGRLLDRVRERRRWIRRLRLAGADDLQAALLGAFSRAYERWGEGSR
jgi:hypothetical protein